MKALQFSDIEEKLKERWEALGDKNRALFRHKFIIHDYEVFPNHVLMCCIVLDNGVAKQIPPMWGAEKIRRFLLENFINNQNTVLVGFNNKQYDNYITDAILAGLYGPNIKFISDELISSDRDSSFREWLSGNLRKRPEWVRRTFDIGFDIGAKYVGEGEKRHKIPEVSLKRWERLNGYAVKRTEVSFDKEQLTCQERAMTERYCQYDVMATAMLFLSDEGWDPCMNARRVLIDEYDGLDWLMTKAKMSEIVLNADKRSYPIPLKWMNGRFHIPSNIRIFKYRKVLETIRDHTYQELQTLSSSEDGLLTMSVCGIPHDYGVGGVHGCIPGIWKCYGDRIFALDAASLYPNIMRHYNLLSRQVSGQNRDRFGKLIDLRTQVYKPAGDKRADGLKLVLNSTFGGMGFSNGELFDPENFIGVTLCGQLLITDLLEKLDRHIELIQSNTDGIFFRIRDPENGLAECTEIVKAFERRTKLQMEWTEFTDMYQRDVSNYVAKTKPKKEGGKSKIKVKGTYFSIKHCTYTPYMLQNRIYSALNDGKRLSPEGMELDRFSIELRRDKNSVCFDIDGKPNFSEFIEVVPLRIGHKKRQSVSVCVRDGTKIPTEENMKTMKHRKATLCPESCALSDSVSIDDIDLGYYETGECSKEITQENLF